MPRLDIITSHFSFSTLRKRSLSAASSTHSAVSPGGAVFSPSGNPRDSIVVASPAIGTINSIMFRQPSIVGLEEERRSFGNELGILEPRPIVYWEGLEERMTA